MKTRDALRRSLVSTTAAIGLALTVGVSTAGAVTSISSSAYGLSADLTVLTLITASVAPVAPAGGMAPGPYSANATVASVADTLNLGVGTQALNTGVITDTASSPFPPTPTGTATSTVNNLATDLAVPLLPSLLDITATTITSTSSVSGFGTLSAIGSSSVENLDITGSALGGTTIDLTGTFVAPPNDIIFNMGGLEIILNQQIHSGDGTNSDGIQTNALAILFNGFALGTGVLNGDIIVAHSQADIEGLAAAVPEPATWSLMLTGFGLLGLAARRRRANLALA